MPGLRWSAVWMLALVCATADARAQVVTRGGFAGLKLEDALARLQGDGLRLIYTSQIVRTDMRVRAEPVGLSPRDVLDQLLRPHGLMARDGPAGTVIVIRNPRARDPSPPTPAAAPSPGPPPLAVPTAEALEALRFAVTVDVADGNGTEGSPGTTPLMVNAREISALAGGFENPFRAVQALPGVVGTQELDSRLSVRGGGPDQNLTLLDGIEIHNPFRLKMAADDAGSVSLASTFNAETIRSVELHPAAFDVRHGDRLSSLLLVEPRDGVETAALRGSAFVGLTDANLILEGRLPRNQRGSW
ncbi:MAG: Plug domain-containing protein [Acidimicrobiia bacterium]|nr:Plug domain-containing protein [Acidimicrobiia bacterium]